MNEATALLLVDLQTGAFGGHGIPPLQDADELLRNVRALLCEARAAGVPVVHVQHCANRGEVFEEGTSGWSIVGALMPEAGEVVVRKRASNAFEGTDLEQVLQRLGARRILVTGLQSEHCVAATCRGALRLGYSVQLAEDGHGTWPDEARSARDIIESENEALAREGVTLRTTDRLVDELRARRPTGMARR